MAKILLFICLLPGILAQCSVERARPVFKNSVYSFAVALTARLSQEYENHFVAATISPWSLLAAASLGAAGQTLDELRRVLRLHRQPCFNDRYFELVNSIAKDAMLERSSTAFLDEKLQITDEYRRRLNGTGIAFEYMSFENPDVLASTINDYIARATHDTIYDVVVPSDLEGVYIVMVDAVYFKGAWNLPFPYENTEVTPFYNDKGAQIGEVNSMSVLGMFNISSLEAVGATVLELPYGTDGRFAMLLFLPHREFLLSTVIDRLKQVSLTTIYALFARDEMQMVSVKMPRFKITSDLNNLKELLTDMGVRSAFDSQLAEFPIISDFSFYISNFVQKASIDVTEEGTTASAATAGFFASRSTPEQFKVDRPFFYMIVDKENQLPIFTGAYSKPSVY